MSNDTSTWSGPYARLREIIDTERESAMNNPNGAYTQGYLDALSLMERVLIERENTEEGE